MAVWQLPIRRSREAHWFDPIDVRGDIPAGEGVSMAGKWKIVAVAAALIVIAAGALWYFNSPLWTLKGIKDAAQSRDAEALNAYIDYPALRQSLKTQLTARMAAEARKDQSGLGAFGMAVGSAMIGPMIDRLVSPAGMRAALLAEAQANRARRLRRFIFPSSRSSCGAAFPSSSLPAPDSRGAGTRFQAAWAFVEAERRGFSAGQVISPG